MLRVCGADGEQKAFAQRQCWCKGLFCGKGGARQSVLFRRACRKSATASTREQFTELLAQLDLFAGGDIAAEWLGRLEGRVFASTGARR